MVDQNRATELLAELLFQRDIELENGVFKLAITPDFFADSYRIRDLLLISRGLIDTELVKRKDADIKFLEDVHGRLDEADAERMLTRQYIDLRDTAYVDATTIALCGSNFVLRRLDSGGMLVQFAGHTGLQTYPLENHAETLMYDQRNQRRMMDGMLPLPEGNISNPAEQRLYLIYRLMDENEAVMQAIMHDFSDRMGVMLQIAQEVYLNPREDGFHPRGVGEFVSNPTESISQKRKKRKARKSSASVPDDHKLSEGAEEG